MTNTPLTGSASPEREPQAVLYADPFESVVLFLRRSWVLIASVAVALSVCAFVAGLLMTKTYRARVLAVPVIGESAQAQLGSLSSAVSGVAARLGLGIGGASGSAALAEEEALATVTSYAFLEQFINDLQLLPILYADRWNPQRGTWDVTDAEDIPTVSDAYDLLKDHVISINRDVRTGLVTLAIEWKDPNLAASWANTLIERVNEVMRQRAISEATKTMDYLNGELERSNVLELRQSIYSVIEANINKVAMANVRREYAFRVIDAAVAPRPDDYEKPKKLLMAVVGFVLGAFAGVMISLIRRDRPKAVSGSDQT